MDMRTIEATMLAIELSNVLYAEEREMVRKRRKKAHRDVRRKSNVTKMAKWKLMLGMLLKAVILAAVLWGIIAIVSTMCSAEEVPEPKYIEYQVQQGDSLWSIAQELESPYKDTRNTVYAIAVANGKTMDSSLKTGEVIKLPIWEKTEK